MTTKKKIQAAQALINEAADLLSTDTSVSAMAVVLRGVGKFDWGFFSREDFRMHLQVVGKRGVFHKVFLERDEGTRCFEPDESDGPIPPDVRNALEAELSKPKVRKEVEEEWVRLMIKKGWIDVKINQGTGFTTLTTYNGVKGSAFKRYLDLKEDVGDQAHEYAPGNWKLDPVYCSLSLGVKPDPDKATMIYLPPIIFKD